MNKTALVYVFVQVFQVISHVLLQSYIFCYKSPNKICKVLEMWRYVCLLAGDKFSSALGDIRSCTQVQCALKSVPSDCFMLVHLRIFYAYIDVTREA